MPTLGNAGNPLWVWGNNAICFSERSGKKQRLMETTWKRLTKQIPSSLAVHSEEMMIHSPIAGGGSKCNHFTPPPKKGKLFCYFVSFFASWFVVFFSVTITEVPNQVILEHRGGLKDSGIFHGERVPYYQTASCQSSCEGLLEWRAWWWQERKWGLWVYVCVCVCVCAHKCLPLGANTIKAQNLKGKLCWLCPGQLLIC